MTTAQGTGTAPGAQQRAVGVRPYAWVLPLWLVVALFGVLTAIAAHEVGIPVRDPHGAWFRNRLGLTLLGCIGLAIVDAAVRARREGLPARRVLQVLRRRWTWPRLALALSALLAYYGVYLCYHNLKSWVVFQQPRDDLLDRWDRSIFLGHSPAVLLHDLLGEHVAAYLLTATYMSFSAVVIFAVVAALTLTDSIREGYVFIASAIWVWILGVGSYWLIPSLGPFAHTPGEFAGLTHTPIQDTQARYLAQRSHLLAAPGAPDATAQIAAFASLHVALVCLILLIARRHRLRRTSQLMTVYLVGTVLATVYLGWHYTLDVVAGIAIAVLALALGRLTIYPRSAPGRNT